MAYNGKTTFMASVQGTLHPNSPGGGGTCPGQYFGTVTFGTLRATGTRCDASISTTFGGSWAGKLEIADLLGRQAWCGPTSASGVAVTNGAYYNFTLYFNSNPTPTSGTWTLNYNFY